MYSTILQLHSYWAYATLALILITVVNSFIGRSSGRDFSVFDRKIAMYALIASHIQLIFGIILLIVSPYMTMLMEQGMGEVMKNSLARQMVVEHPLINIIAIVFITMGWSRHKKKTTDVAKFGSISIFYLIGMLFILSRIPWSNWF